MSNEVALVQKIMIGFLLLELVIALISYVSVSNVPNSPSLKQISGISGNINSTATNMFKPINCGFNFTGSCAFIQITNTSNGVLDINWFLNAVVIFIDVLAEIILFIGGFIILLGIGLYAILFMSLVFLPSIMLSANLGGIGFLFGLVFPVVTIIIAIYAFYVIRNIIQSNK